MNLILDFREIGRAQPEVMSSSAPRFLALDTSQLDPKPSGITDQGEALIQNRFREMDVLPDSNGLVWVARVMSPPNGKILVRWKAK